MNYYQPKQQPPPPKTTSAVQIVSLLLGVFVGIPVLLCGMGVVAMCCLVVFSKPLTKEARARAAWENLIQEKRQIQNKYKQRVAQQPTVGPAQDHGLQNMLDSLIENQRIKELTETTEQKHGPIPPDLLPEFREVSKGDRVVHYYPASRPGSDTWRRREPYETIKPESIDSKVARELESARIMAESQQRALERRAREKAESRERDKRDQLAREEHAQRNREELAQQQRELSERQERELREWHEKNKALTQQIPLPPRVKITPPVINLRPQLDPQQLPRLGAAPEEKPAAGFRTWTNDTGTFQVEAELVRCERDQVELRRRDGKFITLQLEKLSAEDQAIVREKFP